jgi:hypothetical protein
MVRRVRKRDGREVPFDKSKVEHAVRAAQGAVGEEDPLFASEVADVVELALQRLSARSSGELVPGIEDIQDFVEQALIELGRAPVAKAYILYRDKRARIRDALEVHDDRAVDEQLSASRTESPSPAATVRVRESEGLGRWSKGRIVAALMKEADLPRNLADSVASAVEERVFASGLRRISTALIRELVDNELVSMGLSRALQRQGPVAIGRHDLRLLLDDPGFESEPEGPGPIRVRRRIEDALAGEVLRRYALEDLFDERLAELHLSGELHLEDPARLHLDLTRGVPAELLAVGDGPGAAFELLENLAGQVRGVASGLVLEDVGTALASLATKGAAKSTAKGSAKGRGSEPDGLAAWLSALRALSRSSGRRIDLSLSQVSSRSRGSDVRRGRAPAVSAHLIELLARAPEVESPGLRPRLFVDAGDLAGLLADTPTLADSVERMLAVGSLVPAWSRPSERFCGPGLRRAPHERAAIACGAAVGLNLPRLARRAGPWREDRFLELLLEAVGNALDMLDAVASFRRNRRAAEAGGLSGRLGFAITPVGLGEALRWLGDGDVRPGQGARIVGVLDDAVRRYSADRSLTCVLSPYFGRAAGARFAQLDAELFQASQGLLFGDRDAVDGTPGGNGRTVAYASGFLLSGLHQPTAAVAAQVPGEREGELVGTVVSGALHPPLAGLPPGAAQLRGEDHPSLAAWRRFDERRRRATEAAPASELVGNPTSEHLADPMATGPGLAFDPPQVP